MCCRDAYVDAANYRAVLGRVSGASIVEIPRPHNQVARIDSIAPHLGTAPIEASAIGILQANGAYSHPQQLAVLQPLRARLLDPIVWGEAAVHVNFAKLHMQTAQTESGQSD